MNKDIKMNRAQAKLLKVEHTEKAFRLMLKGHSFRSVAKEIGVSAMHISNLCDYIWEYAKTHPSRRDTDRIVYQIHHVKDRFEFANRRASFYEEVIRDWKEFKLKSGG